MGLGLGIRGNTIKFGVTGSADVLGICGPCGNFIAIEIKTGSAIQTKQQKTYQEVIEKLGALYVILRTEKDLDALYDLLSRNECKP